MQFDEARDTISRLIRDVLPGAPAAVASHGAGGGINFFGGANVVQIHMSTPQAAAPLQPAAPAPPDPPPYDHPALLARRKEVLIARLKARSAALGKPDLHLRFLQSVYGTADIDQLGTTALERALAWLETEE